MGGGERSRECGCEGSSLALAGFGYMMLVTGIGNPSRHLLDEHLRLYSALARSP